MFRSFSRPGLAWAGFVLAASAGAQQPAAGPTAPDQTAWRSAFEGYQPFADAAVAPWRESNDTVGRIGGWRAYAREAQGEAPASAPSPPGAASPPSPQGAAPAGAPAKPAAPAAGHVH